MTIYLIMRHDEYVGTFFVAAFSNIEKARIFLDKYFKDDDSFEIQEYELDEALTAN